MKAKTLCAIAAILALVAVSPLCAADGAFGFGNDEAPAPVPSGPSLGGGLFFSLRLFPEPADMAASAWRGVPRARLSLSLAGKSADFLLGFRIDPATIMENPMRVIDELAITTYIGDSVELRGGILKPVWGKGDGFHVLDVLTPLDYSDFVNSSYEDMKIAQPMITGTLRTGDRGKLELAAVPVFYADLIPQSGEWAPKEILDFQAQAFAAFMYGQNPAAAGGKGNGIYYQLYQSVYSSALAQAYPQAYSAALATLSAPPYNLTGTALVSTAASQAEAAAAAAAASVASASDAQIRAQAASQAAAMLESFVVQPDMMRLGAGQAGIRWTGGSGGLDFGLQYYYGFVRTPSYSSDPVVIAAAGNKVVLAYDRVHLFGADAAFALAGFNFRAEGAFNLTRDADGADPLVHNSWFGWTAGVDRGFGGLDVNFQVKGSHILNADRITDAYDIERGAQANAWLLALRLKYGFAKDRYILEATGLCEPTQASFAITPAFTWRPADDIEVKISGTVFSGAAGSRFGQYADKSFVQAGVSYTF